jgi:hypothetical protein
MYLKYGFLNLILTKPKFAVCHQNLYLPLLSSSLSDIFLNKAALSGSQNCGEEKTTARLAKMFLICAATRLRKD